MDLCLCASAILLSPSHSLRFNNLGPEGGRAIAEALMTNTTLTTLEYVWDNGRVMVVGWRS